jgi:hypothetical protein
MTNGVAHDIRLSFLSIIIFINFFSKLMKLKKKEIKIKENSLQNSSQSQYHMPKINTVIRAV